MRRTLYFIPAAMLMAAPFVQARNPKPRTEEQAAKQATLLFHDIDHASRDAVKAGNVLNMSARGERLAWQTRGIYFDEIKSDMNRIGRDVAQLESRQNSLTPLQREALAQTVPLLKSAADSADEAIRIFDNNPSVEAAYGNDLAFTQEVVNDNLRAERKLHDFAILEKAR